MQVKEIQPLGTYKTRNEEMGNKKWGNEEMVVRHAGAIASVRELYVLSFSDAGYLLDSCCVHGVCVCPHHGCGHLSVAFRALFTAVFSVIKTIADISRSPRCGHHLMCGREKHRH